MRRIGLRRAPAALNHARRRPLWVLPLALAACEPNPMAIELADRSVVLHGVLVAGAEQATVVLTEMHEGSVGLNALPLSGARVLLIDGTDTTRLEQRTTGMPCAVSPWVSEAAMLAACYSAAVPARIRSGARYDLHVSLPDGRVIRGSTTVPQPATLLHPEPGAEVVVRRHTAQASGLPLDIGWRHVVPPEFAELRIASAVPDCVILLQSGSALMFAEDVTGAPGAMVQPRLSCREDSWVERLQVAVVLTVFDRNYAHYVRHAMSSGAALHPDAASGITGAFGVFGSAAAARVPLTMVVQ